MIRRQSRPACKALHRLVYLAAPDGAAPLLADPKRACNWTETPESGAKFETGTFRPGWYTRAQNCPAFASSTSTRSSISDRTASRPGSPEEDLRLAAASRSLLTV